MAQTPQINACSHDFCLETDRDFCTVFCLSTYPWTLSSTELDFFLSSWDSLPKWRLFSKRSIKSALLARFLCNMISFPSLYCFMPKEAANQHFVEILFQNDVKREKGTKEHRRKENRKEENRNKDSRKKQKKQRKSGGRYFRGLLHSWLGYNSWLRKQQFLARQTWNLLLGDRAIQSEHLHRHSEMRGSEIQRFSTNPNCQSASTSISTHICGVLTCSCLKKTSQESTKLVEVEGISTRIPQEPPYVNLSLSLYIQYSVMYCSAI